MCSAVSVLLANTDVPTLLVQEVLGKDHAHCLFLYGTPSLKPPDREVEVFIQMTRTIVQTSDDHNKCHHRADQSCPSQYNS